MLAERRLTARLAAVIAHAEAQIALARDESWRQGCQWLLLDLKRLLREFGAEENSGDAENLNENADRPPLGTNA